MDCKRIITDYYNCWVKNDREGARALQTDDLLFRSPSDICDGADDFMDSCWQYARGFESYAPVQEAYGEASAYVAYPVGTMHVGEFIRLRDGKISEIWVTFKVTA